MNRRILGLAIVCGSLVAATQSFATGTCTRDSLQSAVNSYIAAQTKGDPSLMALASPVKYIEQLKDADIKASVLSSPQKIDFSRSFLDTNQCKTFTEVIITDSAHPYVIGTRLKVDGGKISEINSLVSSKGDWAFNAANDLKWSPSEDWSAIPKDKQDSRATIQAAGDAYFNLFGDKSVKVPWGKPCNRLEGGMRTGKGTPDDSCDVGVPSGIKFVDRNYVIDPEYGTVDILVHFGGPTGLPDSHLFRVVDGKIRYVHTITVCAQPGCGFPPPGSKPPGTGAGAPPPPGGQPAVQPAAPAGAPKP